MIENSKSNEIFIFSKLDAALSTPATEETKKKQQILDAEEFLLIRELLGILYFVSENTLINFCWM